MKKIDKLILISVVIISLFGLLMIYSSSSIWAEYKFNDPYKFLKTQAIFLIIGYFIIHIISKIPYQLYKQYSNIILISLVLLEMVLEVGLELVPSESNQANLQN